MPVLAVGGRILLGERDQHALGEAAEFGGGVAGEGEERIAGIEDVAVEIELDDGLGALKRRELVAQRSKIGGG